MWPFHTPKNREGVEVLLLYIVFTIFASLNSKLAIRGGFESLSYPIIKVGTSQLENL